MAPNNLERDTIEKRYYCNGYYYDNNCNYSTWDNWGRWVALAVIVVVVLLLAFLFSCFNTRRRRRLGLAPMYGTGWMPYTGNKPNGAYPQNGGGYYNSYNGGAAPPYSPPVENQQTGNTFNSNEGYYGGHGGYGQNVELQQPQNSYYPQRGGDNVYEAPQGAPPGKRDHVIR